MSSDKSTSANHSTSDSERNDDMMKSVVRSQSVVQRRKQVVRSEEKSVDLWFTILRLVMHSGSFSPANYSQHVLFEFIPWKCEDGKFWYAKEIRNRLWAFLRFCSNDLVFWLEENKMPEACSPYTIIVMESCHFGL